MIGVVFIIGLFILLGIILSMGKGSFLIAGFNTMSKEEKEEYDVGFLCKFMGKVMFIIAFCIILFLLSEIFKIKAIFYIGLILFFVVVIFTLIYTNTGNRFKK
ncbi:DUF3784 domain-containing protein [Clostridium sporogenes]|uniref:DUF3784 domain-containing protein n=1 Tax=Clostridium sporogenes TaxID=1509 RepID=UPI00223738D8|nr:DUF3784 domain-containing protein [Clostridium sporogenes]MCW6109315.1 DUF3784 domain-containing protein [Clostridium sporogenes]